MAKKIEEVADVKSAPVNEYEDTIEALRKQLRDSETVNERLKISLELQDAKKEAAMTSKPSGIEYGPSFNPPNVLDKIAAPYQNAESDQKFRYISTHPTVYALRRGQGYEPVLDKSGAEVRQADLILAKMPKKRFNEEVLKPRSETTSLRKEVIAQRFHETGRDLGVKTFGEIKYDGVNE